jgi:hypothetical protein
MSEKPEQIVNINKEKRTQMLLCLSQLKRKHEYLLILDFIFNL